MNALKAIQSLILSFIFIFVISQKISFFNCLVRDNSFSNSVSRGGLLKDQVTLKLKAVKPRFLP
ncbi:hypothetical protein BpHYR1_027181 [Brachionus plicatilis]|uniref:Uncharacterized protein n=1 Tax=Brachionus plicatilis TaxID=10195 RepID=A0A3M7QQ69_BRAPC|nr:hypothetical protein BpHYR1_027181 [Brachionus plicatilis]